MDSLWFFGRTRFRAGRLLDFFTVKSLGLDSLLNFSLEKV